MMASLNGVFSAPGTLICFTSSLSQKKGHWSVTSAPHFSYPWPTLLINQRISSKRTWRDSLNVYIIYSSGICQGTRLTARQPFSPQCLRHNVRSGHLRSGLINRPLTELGEVQNIERRCSGIDDEGA